MQFPSGQDFFRFPDYVDSALGPSPTCFIMHMWAVSSGANVRSVILSTTQATLTHRAISAFR
jgi:hypothetical protein